MMQTSIHHFIGTFGFINCIQMGSCYAIVCSIGCITEVSTIFLTLKGVLTVHERTKGLFYIVNGILFTVSYFLFRVVNLSAAMGFVTYYFVFKRKIFDPSRPFHWYFLVSFWAIYLLNVFWF